MNTYRKVWLVAFISMALLMGVLFIYVVSTSDDWTKVADELRRLEPSKIHEIRILPMNPDWKINLTLAPIIINKPTQIELILNNLKKFSKKRHIKVPDVYWEMRLEIIPSNPEMLRIKNNESIVLHFKNIESGLFFEMTNILGYQTFQCPDELIPIFEEIAHFKEPLGREQ